MSAQVSESVLQARNITQKIEGVELLSDITLDIQPGEVVALIGPNGSGKTTLLKTLSGEQQPGNGSVRFHNQCLQDWSKKELAQHMAVLPQKSVLNFPFTSSEVVALSRTPHDSGKEIDAKIVAEVLDYLDAGYLAERLYTNLSGGEQQRVQLARVLAQVWNEVEYPRLLILDEPSSFFDLSHQQMLVDLVRGLAKKNIAVLVVLHDINLAMSCADRVAVLSCGRLAAFGETEAVITTEMLESVFSVRAKFLFDPETGCRFLSMTGAVASSKDLAGLS